MSSITNPPAQQLVDGKLTGASDGASYPILNPATGRADRRRARQHRRRRRRRDRGRAPGVRRDRLVDERRAPGALPAAAAPGAARPRRRVPRADHRRGRHARLHDGRRRLRRPGRGPQVGHRPAGVLRVGDRPRRRRSRWASRPGGRCVREPVGVVAAITPWNVPNQINLAKIGPALAAGCTVVLKPAPDTPWVACELGRFVAEHTDIPAGVFNVVTPRSNEVAAVLSSDPRVDMVSFTGSTDTGRAIMAAAAPTLKKVFLELGGKSAAIVLDDADVAAVGGRHGVRRLHPRRPGLRADHAPRRTAGEVRRSGRGRRRHDGVHRRQRPGRPRRDLRAGHQPGAARPGRGLPAPRRGGGRPDRHRRQGRSTSAGFWVEPTVVAGLDNSVARSRRRRSSGRCSSSSRTTATTTPYASPTTVDVRPVRLGRLRRPGARQERRPADPHRDPRGQRRRVVQPRRTVRRLQAVRARPRDGRGRASRSTSRPRPIAEPA